MLIFYYRPSMSQGTVMIQPKFQEKDFTVGTPEEFVRRFGGTKVINKVCIVESNIIFNTFCCQCQYKELD